MLTSTRKLCIHVVDEADRAAGEMLRRMTPVLAAAGARQTFIGVDDKPGSPARGTLALRREFVELFRERAPYAVHFHGVRACLLGMRALTGNFERTRILCSPHVRAFSSPWVSLILGPRLQRELARFHYAALAASPMEAQALSKLLNRTADCLPHVVDGVFFEALRKEDARPVIVADGADFEALALLTRLCVLLNSRGTRVRFVWLGTADDNAKAALEAANIQVAGVVRDSERANWLAGAWAFMDTSAGDGFPHAAIQAMAAGVPCLVSDTPAHRAVIRHGDTGFVCTSERDFLEKLVLLLRHTTERTQVGEAARGEAQRCFTAQKFESAILRAYGFFRMADAPEYPAVRAAANTERKAWIVN